MEKWKFITLGNDETFYMISNLGKVMNSKNNHIYKPTKDSSGYFQVCLYYKGKQYSRKIHKLVAKYFIDNPFNKPEVNHEDGIKTNNIFTNLTWVTRLENMEHAKINGLLKPVKGSAVKTSIYTESDVTKICKLLQQGLTPKEISNLTGFKRNIIISIKSRTSWNHISAKFNFSVKKYKSDIDYQDIDYLLKLGLKIKLVTEIIYGSSFTKRDYYLVRSRKNKIIKNKRFNDYPNTVKNIYVYLS